MALPALAEGAPVPTEVHLMPAGPSIRTNDRRGPYSIDDAEAVIAASFAARDRIEIDVNHATFLAAPKGGEAPAVGWITAMAARSDGIWGTVEWTPLGRRLVKGRAYRGLSPVFNHDPETKRITAILNASLVNRPNLPDLHTLNREEEPSMDWLIELLGLEAGASQEDITA
ncbi:MAG: phage protease, partial [Jannaschia sp.]